MAKFKLIMDDSVTFKGEKAFRIEALRSFGDVKEGDLGGYVSDEKVISDSGDCWVYDNAIAVSGTRISEGVTLHSKAVAWGSVLSGNVTVDGEAIVADSEVSGNCIITGKGFVTDSKLTGDIYVQDSGAVSESEIDGSITVADSAVVDGVELSGKGSIEGQVSIHDVSLKLDACVFSGDAVLDENGIQENKGLKITGKFNRV